MALSFEESKKQALKQATTPALMSLSPIAVNSGENWEQPENHSIYQYYNEYYDDDVSTVDSNKKITLSTNQINLTQENNSQYIPFEIPRYYDGFDLSTTALSIYWVNEVGVGGKSTPVDVYRNTDKIRFAWLVDENVTAKAGKIKFEIQASGKNSKNQNYLWKTKANDGINVIQALQIQTFIRPDDTWQQDFISQISGERIKAENARDDAQRAYSNTKTIYESLQRGIGDEVKNAMGDNYYTKDQVDDKLKNVSVDLTGYATEIYVDEKIASVDVSKQLEDYAKKEYVDEKVASVDVSDQLTEYAKKDELFSKDYNDLINKPIIPTKVSEFENDAGYLTEHQNLDAYATKDYVQEEISKVDVSEQLKDYAKQSDVTNLSSKVNAVEQNVNANKDSITVIGTKVASIEDTIGKIDTDPRKTYDVVYNDTENPEVGENVFALYEITNEDKAGEERKLKTKFTIVGGGGGGTSSTLKIEYVTKSPLIVTTNDKAIIKYNFSGQDSSGDQVATGDFTWKIGKQIIATGVAVNGENTFDATDYISLGTQKLLLTITDDAGSLVTKTWTVQKIDVRLDSSFNDKLTYNIGPVSFDYTPYGAISKDVHFILDGVEIGTVTTSASGIPMAYTVPEQTHGAHLLEVYMTATVNSNVIESNHIYKDIIFYDSTSTVPVIGCTQQSFTALQYDTTNITYTVYDPATEKPVVTLAVDGDVVSTLTIDSNTQVWQYKPSDVGDHVLTITCGETVKTLNVTIEKLDIDVEPVTAGLVFDFNPSGKSNNDTDRLWSDGDITMTVSDNFDWINGGYQIDDNGDQYFCVKSGTSAVINYNLFADDPKKNGKEFKVIFKTTNIKNRDTSFISCMNNDIGLDMKVESANIYSSNNSLYSPYCEEDIIEFEFNINKDTDIPMVLTYEDGVGNRPMIYTSDASFMQSTPQPITIGSEDCDVYIYRMKAYSTSLSDRGILSNFIADARNAYEMIARYNRNQIYDENGLLTPQVLAEKCPDLRIIMVDAPWFTNDKSNKVADTNVTMIYKNGDPVLDNWTCTGAQHSGQGTSSNEYGYAGRNIDLIMNKETSLFTLGDGKTTSKTITLTRDSIPTNYLNVKVNIASSENENNAQLANRYNAYNPFRRSAKIKDSKVKDTMEFYNCVLFIRESNEDITTHREFQDCEWHYYALGNVGDSKKTDSSRVNDKNDPKECVIEIMDYNLPLSEFPTGSDGICPVEDWKEGNTAYDNLYADYEYKDGEFSSFGNTSYEFRYEMKGITDEQREANINAWREFYKFVVTSTDEEFYANLKKYFVVDSALYYYLFTERYTMVDNRAKNNFYHYGKAYFTTEEAAAFAEEFGNEIDTKYIDNDQATFNNGYRWDLTFDYDNDTALGIGNTGKLEITYGKEDTDFYVDGDPSSSYIYRAAESTFFCRVRDLFKSELQAMFVDRENANAWSADSLINQWDKAQSQFPEEIWRLDIQRKYKRTYQGVSIDNSIAGTANPRFLTEMMNGRKKYQRRMFERNQELYMATKYFGNKATQDQIMMRFNNPVGATVAQDYTLYLTPYSDMYIGVKFGNVTPTNFRAKAGVEYTIPYSIEADTADITLIYGASFIQAIGDLSKCYVGDNDFSKASRLQSLVIGSDVEGYENTYMTKITLGNNKLLEYLDIRNVTGLNSVVDLSQCNNLLELHAEGSGATGVIFSNGGKLKSAYIPSVISLTMKNLNNIEVFEVESYDNLQTLVIENTPFINTYDVVNSANKLNTVRLVGINWDSSYNIADSSILERLLLLRGIDNDGYETLVSIISGRFHAAIIKQKQLENYITAWSDLEISYNTLIVQYSVTFMNDDGSVLDVQYVNKGTKAVDPITREDNPIPTPTKESTVSTDYTFAGWDKTLVDAFEDQVITATYFETTRNYTIKYVSNNTVLQETSAPYGSSVLYEGEIPTYTAEESAYKYYLFSGWDQGGYVNGDKTINAVYDSCEYKEGYFVGKEIADMRPVELYMMTKLGLAGIITLTDYVSAKDALTIQLGNDFSYSDIEEQVLISDKTVFNGSNYVDTGVTLLSEDRDFVLAIDCKMDSGNSNNAVLAQCFSGLDTSGFKLAYNSGIKLLWGSSSATPFSVNNREMIVLRHIKGENGIYVYSSNTKGDSSYYVELSGIHSMVHNVSLVFGCSKLEDGSYENYGLGTVYWSKVWYADLGDAVCKKISYWPHESINFEACCESNGSMKRYYLSDNSGARSSIAFISSQTLTHPAVMDTASTNAGGWASFALNSYLNSRVYEAFPDIWKQLMKQVKVKSSIGEKSLTVSSSDCYVFIPSISELVPSMTAEPYGSEGTAISHFTSNDARVCYNSEGVAVQYWTRSPSIDWNNYVFRISTTGAYQAVTQLSAADVYPRIMINI